MSIFMDAQWRARVAAIAHRQEANEETVNREAIYELEKNLGVIGDAVLVLAEELQQLRAAHAAAS